MIIYILRHGETDLNRETRVQGKMATHLNESGIAQAQLTREMIEREALTFDRIYCSPLDRALETCEIATGKSRDEFIIDERVEEIDFGELEGMKYRDLPGEKQYFFTHPDQYVPAGGGESFQDLILRCRDFFEELKSVNAESVLIVSHGTAIHAMLLLFKNKELKDIWDEDVHNCDLTVVDLEDGIYSVRPERIQIAEHKPFHL